MAIDRSIDDIAAAFRRFAERECHGIAPLYEALAAAVAEDESVLALAALTPSGQPVPNMLLAAVHYLLLADADDPLARHYRSLTPDSAPPAAAWPLFRRFCLAHRAAIAELLGSRVVSTNEIGRAACLMPAFARLARQVGGACLHFVEVGASAGLLLLWDRYGYDYGDGAIAGDAGSPVRIHCRLRIGHPDFRLGKARFGRRIGLDRHPIRPSEPDDRRWLAALVWPDMPARLAYLRDALELAVQAPPELRAGDGVALLPEIAAELPSGEPACVYHAFTRNQFDRATRGRFEFALARIATTRPLYHVALEWESDTAPLLRLTSRVDGAVQETLLARCDAHGAWLDWLADR